MCIWDEIVSYIYRALGGRNLHSVLWGYNLGICDWEAYNLFHILWDRNLKRGKILDYLQCQDTPKYVWHQIVRALLSWPKMCIWRVSISNQMNPRICNWEVYHFFHILLLLSLSPSRDQGVIWLTFWAALHDELSYFISVIVKCRECWLAANPGCLSTKQCLATRSHKILKLRDVYLKLSDPSEIWYVLWQQCCRGTYQMSERYDHLTLKHRETHGCIVSTVATDAMVLKH